MIWLPASLFAAGALAHAWLSWRLRSVLRTRHPTLYQEVSGTLFRERLHWFALTRRGHGFGDPELARLIRQINALYPVSIAAWVATMVAIVAG